MTGKDKKELLGLLARCFASKQLNARFVLPALEALARDDPDDVSLSTLLDALEGQEGDAVARLIVHLQRTLRADAIEYYRLRKSGRAIPDEIGASLADLPLNAPAGWRTVEETVETVQSALLLLRDLHFVSSHRGEDAGATAVVEKEFRDSIEATYESPEVWAQLVPLDLIREVERTAGDERPDLLDALGRLRAGIEEQQEKGGGLDAWPGDGGLLPFPPHVAEGDLLELLRFEFGAAETPQEREKVIDLICSWPSSRAAPVILELVTEPRLESRADLVLKLRFGGSAASGWANWRQWLGRCDLQITKPLATIGDLVRDHAGELLFIWYSGQQDADPEVLESLRSWCDEAVQSVGLDDFIERWAEEIDSDEWMDILSGTPKREPDLSPEPTPEPPVEQVVVAATPDLLDDEPITISEALPEQEAPAEPADEAAPRPEREEARPRQPTLWQAHVQPFFFENWYIMAGILMVIAGSSLLAYYTWDKHWLVRYTIMPFLLAGFTACLGGMGSWIERKDEQFRATASILRAAAIGLLPVNFMAVALLSSDPEVTYKALAVLVMGTVYLSLAGWGLKRWCASVHSSLGLLLGGGLLALNSLVVLGPIFQTAGGSEGQAPPLLIGIGFHLGFFVLAAVVVRFTRKVLTVEMAVEKRVPWFLGATLGLTFLQVFAWVHGFTHHLPEVYTYAPMIVLTGWLVLFVERGALELSGKDGQHGAESFLGYAFILMGILMGATQEYVRILVFLMAGVLWIYQAGAWRSQLQYWIGLTFLVLGGAAVGLLDSFPGPWLPGLGIALALSMGALSFLVRKVDFAQAAIGMQAALLMLSAAVMVLAQWHYHDQSPPLATAAGLVVIAALFAWRAYRDDELRWVHTAMVVLAIALPYLGFVDVSGRTLQGNTMVFGLSILAVLWLGLTRLRRSPLIIRARSTVLLLYGGLAVAAMLLRVVIEPGQPQYMDYLGPLLMIPVLALTTYYCRSVIPAIMAMVIGVILLPELKRQFEETFSLLGWGTGLGSSLAALVLISSCFPLRGAAFLKDLGEGDLFLGRDPFPFRRYDHTLFTWVISASAVFLAVKVDSWLLLKNIRGDGVVIKTAMALCASGVCWKLLGVYFRRHRGAVICTHLGWIWLVVGLSFGYRSLADSAPWTSLALLNMLMLQLLFFGYRFLLEVRWPWVAELLTAPVRQVLRYGSLMLAAALVIDLATGGDIHDLEPLAILLAIQLVWHGLSTGRLIHGAVLFLLSLTILLAWNSPGVIIDRFLRRSFFDQTLIPTLWLLLAVQAFHVLLEIAKRSVYKILRPILLPFSFGSTLLAVFLGLCGIFAAVFLDAFSTGQLTLLLIVGVLTARAHASGPMVLLSLLLAYVFACQGTFIESSGLAARLRLLGLPWAVSLFSLGMTIVGIGICFLAPRRPGLLVGPFGIPLFRRASIAWIYLPAGVLACLAAKVHTVEPSLRESPIQLLAPYLGAAALGLIAWSWRRSSIILVCAVLLMLGNIHVIRVSVGELLRQNGLSEIHLLCLGLAASLLQLSIVGVRVRKAAAVKSLALARLSLAGLVLLLLSANYFSHPDLGSIESLRFWVSGTMAYLAGLYFRQEARRPGPFESHKAWWEGLYHFGVTMAIWCAALSIPWLRNSTAALWVLGLPAFYFYLRAEMGARSMRAEAARYRNSASVLSFIILALYVFRGTFQMVLFSDVPIGTDHYHHSAPFLVLVALVMLRLKGLGGTPWLAFYGGLAMMLGSYFSLTLFPGLSPFSHPVPAAWCAVGLGHFWTLFSTRRSPLRTAVQRMGVIDEKALYDYRRSWGMCLLAATHGAVLWGILGRDSADSYSVAPLLLGAASLLLHHAVVRKSPIYLGIGFLEIVLVLHADFLLESWLPKDFVIWVLLAVWGVALFTPLRTRPRIMGWASLALGGLTMAHVLFYHHPGSPAGLWAVAVGGFLASWTLREDRLARSGGELCAAAALAVIPVWLVYFSQAPLRANGLDGGLELWTWPVLATTATLFLVGCFARFFQLVLAPGYAELARPQPRLFDLTLSWFESSGAMIQRAVLLLSLFLVAGIQATHYGTAFKFAELVVVMGLYCGLGLAWYYEGRIRKSMLAYFILQFCVLAFFLALRRHLMLTTGFWTPEYDVWASLVVSAGLAGSKEHFDVKPREVRLPLMSTLFALPVLAMAWVLVHDLGSNTALLVVGMQSLIFAYMGKGDRDSPYRVVAIAGFVVFVLLFFWTKLELRVVPAYVLPVGLGVLVLLQMLRNRVTPGARNQIRLVTVLSMLGSTGYSALLDEEYTLAFLGVFSLLCLMSMGLGSFLRVRIYLLLGFCGLVVAIGVIFYRVSNTMDRGPRMTVIGSIILLVGAALVFGAIYYKTHREQLISRYQTWRERLGGWE